MITEQAKELTAKIKKKTDAEYLERSEERNFMICNKVCPACAVPVKTKWCGFLWQCLSYICPKCKKRYDSYPLEGIC